jgi:hypothetical protein
MSQDPNQTPFELLLKVVDLLQPDVLRLFQECVPFIRLAKWASVRLSYEELRSLQLVRVDAAIGHLASGLADQGEPNPDRILAFFIMDWERIELALIDQILTQLSEHFPGIQIEAMCFAPRKDPSFEMVLVAGTEGPAH